VLDQCLDCQSTFTANIVRSKDDYLKSILFLSRSQDMELVLHVEIYQLCDLKVYERIRVCEKREVEI
jgi:hypothetical protein